MIPTTRLLAGTLLTLLVLALSTNATATPHDVYGLWLTEAKTSAVEIIDCEGSPCGYVRWLDPETAQVTTDVNNPDAAKRQEPLVGLKILSAFERKRKGWDAGRIYDPESGKTYKSKLALDEDGSLSVKGCIAFFCQTQHWQKIKALPTGSP